jgi:hypothetical protein
MRQEQQHKLSMAQQAQMASYRPMQQLSVQPEAISPKMDPYLSCKILYSTWNIGSVAG